MEELRAFERIHNGDDAIIGHVQVGADKDVRVRQRILGGEGRIGRLQMRQRPLRQLPAADFFVVYENLHCAACCQIRRGIRTHVNAIQDVVGRWIIDLQICEYADVQMTC